MVRPSWIVALAILLGGCATAYHENHRVEAIEVMFDSDARDICDGARACYFPNLNLIVAERDDWPAVGYEMCHVIFGDGEHVADCPWYEHPKLKIGAYRR